ncbi:Signal transduction histidine kinase [Desulfuromusa kysingii]|uniref:histidine kinase n=1 Tax=Desulfuromusa kysingii TaxID=37625 RepID=A0A1H4DXL2_9BACT|nr:ATP-binding protein [Desulfuromusa kysingii]SEA77491.1 Signal transduction histidine kinase [Desulfuromusa kysingii]
MKWINSIAFRLSASIAVVILATALTVASVILSEEQKALENYLRIRAFQLGEIMSRQMIEPLLYEELYTVYTLFESYIKSADSIIVYAETYDPEGRFLLHSDEVPKIVKLPVELSSYQTEAGFINPSESINSGRAFDLIYPIIAPNLGHIGYLRLGITPVHLIETLEHIKKKVLVVTAGIVFSGILAGLWMARRIIKPILVLNHAVLQLEEETLGEDIEILGIGEIRELTLSFNAMSKKLKESMVAIKTTQEALVRKEKLYVLGEFSAGLAHEIKNPLTPIKMLIQRAYEQNEPLEGDDLVIVNDEIKRIDKIVSQFLGYARMNEPRIESVDINRLIKDVVTLTKQKIEKSGVEFILEIEELSANLDANADGLKQVIINLVLNALQAMPDGGVITLSVSGDDKHIRIEVSDSGVGMSEEQMTKIFNPFFTTKQNGTGLGLAVVWNVIESLNGKIQFFSKPQQGTKVVVSLPYE